MSRQAWMLLLLLSFIWGASFLFIELALEVMGPVTLVFFRVLVGAVCLIAYLKSRHIKLPSSKAFWVPVFVMGLLNNVIPFSLISYGQVFITGGMASIINANTAFFGVIVAALFLVDERLQLSRLLGVMIGISGVIIVVGPQNLTDFNPASVGQLAIVGATLSYALASVWGKLRLQGYDSEAIACGMLIAATILMAPLMIWLEGIPHFKLSFQLTGVFIGLGAIGTSIAYLLYFRILKLAGASNLMLVTIIVPVFAVLLDALVLAQFVSIADGIGFVIVAVGLAIMDGRLGRQKAQKP